MEKYMLRAIELAKRGTGLVAPNPLVGAVIVKDGRIIGEGWHKKYGELHAERHALQNCTESAEGADIYVTLEPCCHFGKQPPCTQALIDAGIKRVFVGSYDPNPLVSGKSGRILREAGIETVYETLKEECDSLNPFFFHYITKKRPYVICKYAMSADGKTACFNGSSRWVTGEAARQNVQETRKAVSAIMVGIGTVLADDPSLLCHMEDPVHPVRVVCDTHLRMPLDCQLLRSVSESPVIIMTCSEDTEKTAELESLGAEIVNVPADDEGHTDIKAVLLKLAERGLSSVLIEGGAKLHAAALKSELVNEVQVYIAPKIVGCEGISAVGEMGLPDMNNALTMGTPKIQTFGQDILLTYKCREA